MRSQKKLSKGFLFGAILALVFTLAACGSSSKGPSSSGTEQSSGEKVPGTDGSKSNQQVTLKFLYIWPEHKTVMEKTISDFEATHPNIKVDVSVTPWDKVREQLQTSIAAGDPPDVTFYWPSDMSVFISIDSALDLTPYMDDQWKNSFLSPDELSDGIYNGKLYNVPFRGTGEFLAYNKDMFDKNGWKVPTTLEELESLMQDMVKKDIIPFAIAGKPHGAKIAAVNSSLVTFNAITAGLTNDPQYMKMRKVDVDGPYAEAFKKTKDWYEKGYFGKSPEAVEREAAQTLFFEQRAAMIFLNNNELTDLRAGTNGKFTPSFTAFPSPASIKDAVIDGGFDGFFVYSKTKHPAEAVELLKWLTSHDAQQPWADNAGSVMTVKGVEYHDEALKTFADYIGIAGKYRKKPDYNSGNVADRNDDELVNFLINKIKTAEQLQTIWNENIKEQIADNN